MAVIRNLVVRVHHYGRIDYIFMNPGSKVRLETDVENLGRCLEFAVTPGRAIVEGPRPSANALGPDERAQAERAHDHSSRRGSPTLPKCA